MTDTRATVRTAIVIETVVTGKRIGDIAIEAEIGGETEMWMVT